MHQQHLDLMGTFDEMAVLLPPRTRPDAERVEYQSVAWFDRVQLPAERLKWEGMRRSETGRSFPRLSYETTAFWARFSLWYFTFDGVRAEDTAARDLPGFLDEAGRLWRMLHDATPPERFGDPFASVLGSLLAELDDLAPAVTANRVRQALRDYLFAAAWEAVNRATPLISILSAECGDAIAGECQCDTRHDRLHAAEHVSKRLPDLWAVFCQYAPEVVSAEVAVLDDDSRACILLAIFPAELPHRAVATYRRLVTTAGCGAVTVAATQRKISRLRTHLRKVWPPELLPPGIKTAGMPFDGDTETEEVP